MGQKKPEFNNRDLSWLSFNERVLQEAEDPKVPLLERLRFLGINSNNRDEFFRVRVATIRRMIKFGKKGEELIGANPVRLLEKIQRVVLNQQVRFEKTYSALLKELEAQKIFMIDEKRLNAAQGRFVRDFFFEKVEPFLSPIMIDSVTKFPYLKDKSVYLAVKLSRKKKDKKSAYAIIEIPTDEVSRFLVLPTDDKTTKIIMLDDVIRYCLADIFSIFDFDDIRAFAIKLTRDAELDIDNDVSKGWMEKIEKSVKLRKKGAPVRLAYDQLIPDDLLEFILKKINIHKAEYLIPGGRYHNFKDFIRFPSLGRKDLLYKPTVPLEHPELAGQRSLFRVIRQKDILLAYPYQSFSHIIDLLKEASIDPKVISIHLTLYRAARNSSIVNSLINAVKNGKQVTAVVELQARFDEETNIQLANRLQDEGANVIFGVPGLKVHSKLFLIARKEEGKIVHYAHIGTGNFNEQTAKLYTDHTLLTSDQRITREVERLFAFYKDNYKTGHYKYLIVSPFSTRKRFIKLIDQEIENAKAGKPAWMMLKMNSLVDREMIEKLYEASSAGVKIRMIVRGICALVTDFPGLSDNISVVSIVDKFLEHSRIFIFCGGGDEQVYIGSSDWMSRNLDYRSEVSTPIFDPLLRMQLKSYLEQQFSDTTKARRIDRNQVNKYVEQKGATPKRAQEDLYRWYRTTAPWIVPVQKLTAAVRRMKEK